MLQQLLCDTKVSDNSTNNANNSAGIVVSDYSVNFSPTPLFHNFCINFAAGKFTTLLGKSGVGKSTLLKSIAGFNKKTHYSGNIKAKDNLPLPPRIAWMGQTTELIPWLNVINNACLGYRIRGEKSPIEQAAFLLDKVGIYDYKYDKISNLSGGMKQRLALVRTVIENKPIILMDEPFSSLDSITRMEMQALASDLLQNKTVICVTHDPVEAIRMSDEINILSKKPVIYNSISVPKDGNSKKIASSEFEEILDQILAIIKGDQQTSD